MTSDQSEGGTLGVLLIEDNPGDARLLEEYLAGAEMLAAELERASTLKDALELLRNGAAPPDVVLLDLGLPDAGGLEAVEAVVEAAPELPVVVLTGRDDRRTAVEALRDGAEDYLLKGEVGPDVLARSVRYAVERKRAERELAAERARLQEVFEAAPAWIATLRGPEHVFEMVNPAFREMMGGRELIGLPAREAVPEAEDQGYFEVLDRVYESGESYRAEERPMGLDRPDGTTELLYRNFVYQPRREDGEVVGVIAHGVDVTEQVERRREAEERKKQLDRVLETSAEAIMLTDAEGMFTYANPAAEEMLGLGASAITSRSYRDPDWEIRGPDGELLPDEELPVGRVLKSGETVKDVGLSLKRPDGGRRVLSAHAAPLEGPDGEPQGVVTSLRDVTESREAQSALAESRERFRALAENAADGIVIITAESRIVYANPAMARMLGYEREELEGTSLMRLIPEDLRDRHRRGLARYRETGERSLDWGGVQFPALRRDGTRVDVEVSFGEYEVGGERLFTGMIRDISERKEAQETLRQAREMFEGVFETSPVGLKIVDAETNEYRKVNESFTEQFGYTREELEAGEVRDEDLWPDPARRRRIYDRVARGGRVRNVEVQLRRRDGSVFDALFSASPLTVDGRRYVVAAVQDISYQKEVERELSHRTLHDELTGLANRALLDDRLGRALERSGRTGEALAVFFVDLKRFKVINDSLGHEAGDRVLEEVADRLITAVREQDTAARIGGDEFAVLLEEVEGEGEARRAADRILEVFDEPISLGDQDVTVEASVGVSLHSGADADGSPAPTDLLRWAEEAMYRAKEKPGSAWALADPGRPSPDTSAIELERRFREALEEGRIGTVYQPVVGARDGELRSVEALSRWHDPELGEVPPGTFIPIAEGTGLIVELGEQQLEEACRSLLAESAPGGVETERPLRLQVNLSSYQLEDPEVVERVRGVLERTGFAPARLCLEVTESAAAREPEVVDRLGELGVKLAIDDFGTRYSTLAQLKRLRVNALKIDRTFVDGLPADDRDRAIVASVLTLGHALGLSVVAEGVETAEQWELLGELGVDEVQGFHVARPMAMEELREWVEARS